MDSILLLIIVKNVTKRGKSGNTNNFSRFYQTCVVSLLLPNFFSLQIEKKREDPSFLTNNFVDVVIKV